MLIRCRETGGSIGAGLFVATGPGFHNGGPGSVVSTGMFSWRPKVLSTSIQLLGFLITGAMMLFTIQALGELAVLYPVNGAFYSYMCRFLDPAWYVDVWHMDPLRGTSSLIGLGASPLGGTMPFPGSRSYPLSSSQQA